MEGEGPPEEVKVSGKDEEGHAPPKKQEGGGWLEGRTKYILSYALETWYESLKEHTPRTTFITLSREQREALYELCRERCSGLRRQEAEGNKQESKALEEFRRAVAGLSSAHQQHVTEIVKRVDEAITEYNGEAFVKLSTRSPKDAVNGSVNARMVEYLSRELAQSDGTPNGASVAFVTASRKAFRVTSGEEGVDLLVQSSRVMEDLMKVLELSDDSEYPFNIIVREWFEMQPQMEFRVFVKNKQITAISQYCYYQYFAELPDLRESIKNKIFTLWDEIAERVPQENSVVDFVVLEDRALIIELNPFFGDTGACLFTWRDPERKILHGEAPFEFRVLTEPKGDPLGCFPTEWVDFMLAHTPSLASAYPKRRKAAVAAKQQSRKACLLC